MTSGVKKAAGCGCGAVLAVVMVISFVGWALSFMDGAAPMRQLQPIPDNVPPAAGEPVPSIDIYAEGRTAEFLGFWAAPIAADTGISSQAIAAYGNAALVAAEAWPECGISWTTLAGIGYVETRHGTYSGKLFGGSALDGKGVATPSIVGIPLDGSPAATSVPTSLGSPPNSMARVGTR